MDITPDKRKLVALVEQAHHGDLCLPEFQRDFVWPREQVADLVRSVLRGYYVGSVLLLHTNPDHPPFQPSFLRGAKPKGTSPRPKQLVLDGQQRLTSLMYALTAPEYNLKETSKPRRFFVDLQKALSDIDDDGIVFDVATEDLGDLATPEGQFERLLLPCTALLESGTFSKWKDKLDDHLSATDKARQQQYRDEWRDPWTELVTRFQTFQVAVVELPQVEESDPDALGRICAIFEKLNSNGVELSVYDLLTARLYRSGIKLHDLWRASCDQHSRLNDWSGGKAETLKLGVIILRVLALLRDVTPTPKELIKLSPKEFQKDWNRAAQGVERALEHLESIGPDGFGVFDRQWLPGTGLIAVLAAGRQRIEEQKLVGFERASLRRWYWCSVFLERYSSAVETKARRDFTDLLAYWAGGSEPGVFAEAQARMGTPAYSIRGSASSGSSVYSGVFCLLALNGARDWRRNEALTLQKLEDHHIFPRAYLRRAGITRRTLVNTVLNRTLISDETNRLIRDKSPSEYTAWDKVFPNGASEKVLATHFLGGAARDDLMWADDTLSPEAIENVYDHFLAEREALILAEVRSRCGVDLVN
ncbi:DUF262 domain-containing protein [Deinococcus sp.]|uniref:GmrSD restriction endonuclease domain-containing protein n=1 Tax=Deinococcus sp. TaxID=47478 RepID=UPI0025C63F12|nr:DUF262 domain-containing protein [Deinococcus sp.]